MRIILGRLARQAPRQNGMHLPYSATNPWLRVTWSRVWDAAHTIDSNECSRAGNIALEACRTGGASTSSMFFSIIYTFDLHVFLMLNGLWQLHVFA